MNIIYLANARMPTEKAHGIQIAKTCEAFIEQGLEVELVVPQRATVPGSVREFYGLRRDVPLVRLPVIDSYRLGKLGFYLGSLTFMLTSLCYLRRRARRGERFIVYTVDMDAFSGALLRFVGRPYYSEMHFPKRSSIATRLFMRKAAGIIAINTHVAAQLMRTFGLPQERVLVEPNGVDIAAFASEVPVDEARSRLGLPPGPLALYIGRFYPWKGLGILADAFAALPEVACALVGGTREQFVAATGRTDVPRNLLFMGDQPPASIPLWQRAAGALVVLGTRANDDSYYYTAPMKIFEYFAARRPVVASKTPALTELVGAVPVHWYEPDQPQSLAAAVRAALAGADAPALEAALGAARAHDWGSRAARIRAFIER